MRFFHRPTRLTIHARNADTDAPPVLLAPGNELLLTSEGNPVLRLVFKRDQTLEVTLLAPFIKGSPAQFRRWAEFGEKEYTPPPAPEGTW